MSGYYTLNDSIHIIVEIEVLCGFKGPQPFFARNQLIRERGREGGRENVKKVCRDSYEFNTNSFRL